MQVNPLGVLTSMSGLSLMLCAGDSPGWSKSGLHSSKSSVADPLSKARSASLRREASPYMSPRRSLSPVSCDLRSDEHRGGLVQFDIPGLPPELQGVSVKELVKAIGNVVHVVHQ